MLAERASAVVVLDGSVQQSRRRAAGLAPLRLKSGTSHVLTFDLHTAQQHTQRAASTIPLLLCRCGMHIRHRAHHAPGCTTHSIAAEQEERAARDQALEGATGASASGAVRKANFCRKCQAWKPPRCHHCSVTGRCVLKLDHYCVWVAAPVGLLNYKFFLLFLLYSTLACAEATAVMLPVAIGILMRDGPASRGASVVLFAAIFCFAFAIALTAFLTMHWDMLAKNYTSIESIGANTRALSRMKAGRKRLLASLEALVASITMCQR